MKMLRTTTDKVPVPGGLNDYMINRVTLMRVLLSLCFCFWMAGCRASWVANVKNETGSVVTIEIGSSLGEIKPGQTVKLGLPPCPPSELYTRVFLARSEGRIIGQTNAQELLNMTAKNGATYPNIYLVVSGTGIVVPTNQRPTTQ